MDVLLISFSLCLLGVMVTVLLFSLAMRPHDEEEPTVQRKPTVPSEGFFLEGADEPHTQREAPSNSLLLELEHHVRSEHKAAETFIQGPNPDSLHAPSDSPLWN